MNKSCPHDPFAEARKKVGVLPAEFQGEPVPLILRYHDLREAARDTLTYSSATPCRVPIPSEESVRSVAQLPLEVDPPEHTDYREIVEPFFKRPNQPDYIRAIQDLMRRSLDEAFRSGTFEAVREFAVPLQSRALAHLMNLSESEAEIWIGWGTHVFREGHGEKKGAALEEYIHARIDQALQDPGDDFFGALTKADFRGRKLSRDEIAGYASIMFAGGRDTVINSIVGIFAYLGEHPEALEAMRENPKLIITAGEELVRVISPVTHIARTCTRDSDIHGVPVTAGQRVSLCFASANYDETVFESPAEVRLDRKPNAHVAFGSGPHFCLGAPHARLIIRTLLTQLVERVKEIQIVEAERNAPSDSEYLRHVGYRRLVVKINQQPAD